MTAKYLLWRLLRRLGAVAGLVLAAALCSQVQAQTTDVCDRTPQIRDKILSDLSAPACESVSVQGLAGIVEFDLSSSTLNSLDIPRLTAVKAGDFDGFDGLVTLDMSSNRLTTLPPDWAGDIKDTLLRLDLRNNEIEILLPGIFAGLAGLGAGDPSPGCVINCEPYDPASGERGGSLRLVGNPTPFRMTPEIRVKRVVSDVELEIVVYYPPGIPVPAEVLIDVSGLDGDKTDTYSGGRINTRFAPGETETSPPLTVVRADGQTARLEMNTVRMYRATHATDCDHGDEYDDDARCYSGFEGRAGPAAPFSWDGTTPAPPRVSTVVFLPAPRYIADAYLGGAEHVVANVIFDKSVLVEGRVPTLELDVGGRKRVAEYVPLIGLDDGGFRSNVVPLAHIYSFLYSFSTGDEDTDGIRIHSANALKLGSAEMTGQFRQPADLNLGGFLEPHADRKVLPLKVVSVEITSEPQSEDDVYAATDVEDEQEGIVVELIFSTEVTVEGAPGLNPGLNLEIGDTTRLATYDAELNPVATSPRLVFRYKPVAADNDLDGISIRTDALVLPEGVRIHVLDVDVNLRLPEATGGYAVRDAANHKVRGAAGVLNTAIISAPRLGGAYAGTDFPEEQETIRVEVVFNVEAEIMGSPTLNLEIGATTRAATHERDPLAPTNPATNRIVFAYNPVGDDHDDDGISIRTDALMTAPGTSIRFEGEDVNLGLLGVRSTEEYFARNAAGHRVVPQARVTGFSVISAPRRGGDFYVGTDVEAEQEAILLEVAFSTAVAVVGSPTLRVEIGDTTRLATYETDLNVASTDRLVFVYRPTSADRDPDGINVPVNALTLSDGARILSWGVGVRRDLPGADGYAVRNAAEHQVRAQANVERFAIISAPHNGDTYIGRDDPAEREEIVLEVVFSTAVTIETPDNSSPSLNLEIGDATRTAVYDSSGDDTVTTNRLVFIYRPTGDDHDLNGISVRTDALMISEGVRIRASGIDANRNLPAERGEEAPGEDGYAVRDAAGHKVRSERRSGAGVIRIAVVSTPRNGAAYVGTNNPAEREEILLEVVFSTAVAVEGAPQLHLEIGAATRIATYDAELNPEATTDRLVFRYLPTGDDHDPDGVSVRINALRLPAGSRILFSGVGADPALPAAGAGPGEDGYAVRNAAGHKVRAQAKVTSFSIVSEPRGGDTYIGTNNPAEQEEILLEVVFSTAVAVEGAPQLHLEIGDTTRIATYDANLNPETTDRLVFRYLPTGDDHDPNGISVRTNALRLPAGSRILFLGVGADPALPGAGAGPGEDGYAVRNAAGHKVRAQAKVASFSIVSEPRDGDAYIGTNNPAEQEEILLEVVFSTAVAVEGAPQLHLQIGAATRIATYDANLNPETTTNRLVFRYLLTGNDHDPDGISVRTNALRLPAGSRILFSGVGADPALPAAGLDARGYAVLNDVNHRVQITAGVTRTAIVSVPRFGDTYAGTDLPAQQETIRVEVVLSVEAEISGRPLLNLEIGAATRVATYDGDSPATTNRLLFTYRPTGDDRDENGISVRAGALALPAGASIRFEGEAVETGLLGAGAGGPGEYVIRDAAGHKVRPRPGVVSFAIVSTPRSGDAYIGADNPAEQEEILLEVTFSTAVAVEGGPVLILEIGDTTRAATYERNPAVTTNRLLFAYNPAGDDGDEDGISVRADALFLPAGARIHDSEVDADLRLSRVDAYAVRNAAGHKVAASAPDGTNLRVRVFLEGALE